MPNHVLNVLVLSGTGASDTLTRLLNDEGEFDFDRILPMPPELDVEDESFAQTLHGALYGGWQKVAAYPWVPDEVRANRWNLVRFLVGRFGPRCTALAGRYELNRRRHGAKTWYDWRLEHWGCKWNAYRTEVLDVAPERARVVFETPWSPPLPVLEALAAQVPALELRLAYVDEFVNFAGYARFARGRLVEKRDGIGEWVREFEDVDRMRAFLPPPEQAFATEEATEPLVEDVPSGGRMVH